MKNALLEIGVEELPASEFSSLLSQLQELTASTLEKFGVRCSSYDVFVGSRRFGVLLRGLPDRQEDSLEEKKGPPVSIAYEQDRPTKALEGFLKSNNASLDQITVRNGYVYLVRKVEGKLVEEVLPEIFKEIVVGLSFKKTMRWGTGEYEFVRPVHWIVAMVEDRVLDLELFGVKASNKTYGKRYHSGIIPISHVNEYFERLKGGYVIADHRERKETILRHLEEFEKRTGMVVERDESLIDEIVAITEYPVPVVGRFSGEYLSLPEEVIVTTVKHHQRAFIARRDRVTNFFIAFQDGPQSPEQVVKGYERVINARLEDARYYFQKDLATPLEVMNEKLKEIVFQERLGTLYDKVIRIQKISESVCHQLDFPKEYLDKVLKAARICKADIASRVVFEFPELQGVMGRIYALREGFEEDVAWAVEDHYSESPKTVIGAVLGIADRLDTVCGNFLIGNVPSGSKDPYGLRSKVDAVYRIVRKYEWDLDLWGLVDETMDLLNAEVSDELIRFFENRFYQFLVGEHGIRFDIARAVNHLWRRPLRGVLAAEALKEFADREDFQDLFVGFERVHNIVKNHDSTSFDGSLFEQEEERELLNKFLEVKDKVLKALSHLNYREALSRLAELKPYIDRYFDNVFVMVKRDDIRLNRLGFLKNVDELFVKVGDMSHLVKRNP